MSITVRNLSKGYIKNKRAIRVLENFSYHFETGKLYLIEGESGRGKTTLLTLIALLQKEDSGEIFFNDRQVNGLSSREKTRIRLKEIGIIFQDYFLFAGFTVLENIILASVCEKILSPESAKKKAGEILEMLKLDHRMHHFPHELSGGEQQRAGIARAIFNNPGILVCDEPVSNLDHKNAEIIINFLENFSHGENKLVLVTGHNEDFRKFADTCINL